MATDLKVHALGPQGDGIHNSDSGPIYIERTLPGDVVSVRVHRGSGGVLRGEVVQLVQASPDRATPQCPHYEVCGGCTLQHATDELYRTWKINIVRAALHKSGLTPAQWLDPIFVSARSRRRVTFAASKKRNIVTLGYARRRSHDVTDITACLVADPAIMALRARLVGALATLLQNGKPADVFIQTVDGQTEVVITGSIGQTGKPDLSVYEAVAEIGHALKLCRIAWRARDRDDPEVLIEINPLVAKFGALKVALPPLAFLQPTKVGEAALVQAVMSMLPASGVFADLFSGCGTFAGAMLERGKVAAFDNVAPAIATLNKARGAQPLTATHRDLFRNPLAASELQRYDAVVFDPPRAGAENQAKALANSKVPIIIGVSCNPATFARDARILLDGGYELDQIQVVDQFTWSHHVEVVARFILSSALGKSR